MRECSGKRRKERSVTPSSNPNFLQGIFQTGTSNAVRDAATGTETVYIFKGNLDRAQARFREYICLVSYVILSTRIGT